jgi:hypothetical protein
VNRDGFEWDDLRAASGAVEHPVRQAAHLRVPALACVLTQSVRQGGYPLEGPQYGTLDGPAAKVTMDLNAVGRAQFTRFAEGTDRGVRSGE